MGLAVSMRIVSGMRGCLWGGLCMGLGSSVCKASIVLAAMKMVI